MGKKAQIRNQAKNKGWDDLNKTARLIRNALPAPFIAIHQTLCSPGIKANLNPEKLKKIAVLHKALQEDTGFFLDLSDQISSGHKDKKGGWKDDKELMQIIESSEKHRQLQTQADAVITPTYQALVQECLSAEMALAELAQKIKEEIPATDNTVVTAQVEEPQ